MAPKSLAAAEFTQADLKSLEMLYRSEVRPGMTPEEAVAALR